MENVSTSNNTTEVDAKSLTMYQVLRMHSMGELHLQSNPVLTAAYSIVLARINYLESYLRTHNLFKNRVSEINADLRWYIKIGEDITTLLTAEFHQK